MRHSLCNGLLWIGSRNGELFRNEVAEQVIGRKEGDTAFDKLTFETRPFYTGKPWFLPATVAYYRWRDGTDQGNKTSVV